MRIIIGLGNPGEKYKLTRHNAGFMAVDAIAVRHGSDWRYNKKFKAEICDIGNALLVKPQTFMNNSGQSARVVMSFYKLLPKKFGLFAAEQSDLSDTLTVIHDDIDIELGKYKISVNSRAAGHKGVESIIDSLKTKNFKRARIGICAKMPADLPRRSAAEAGKFVLQKFSEEEIKIIDNIIADLAISLK